MNNIYKFYYSFPHDSAFGIVSKAFNRILARIIKRYFDRTVPKHYKHHVSFLSGINNLEKRKRKYIISLTSFPERIDDIWIAIESIFRQTFKPDIIILWLSKDQFKGIKLPKNLILLKKRGLTIRFVDGDIRSHKKYKYALEEFPNDYIITIDDDLYYDEDLIQNLINLKKKFPNCVPTNRAHKLNFKNNLILPYRKWIHNSFDTIPSHKLVQTGGYGTLYNVNDLHADYKNENLFLKLAPFADDLWLKIMVLKKGKKVVTNNKYNKDPLVIRGTQLNKLVTENVTMGGNDIQFNNMLDQYSLTAKDFLNES